MLGVSPDATTDQLRAAYLKKSYKLIQEGATQVDKDHLRAAHDGLQACLVQIVEKPKLVIEWVPPTLPRYVAPKKKAEDESNFDPLSYTSPYVDILAPPIVVALSILLTISPLGFMLVGFQIWVHEFGHATLAWMTGKRAIPLPIGWTNIEFERSYFVYFGVLFLLGLLFVASAREKRLVPMVIAVLLAGAQWYLTWRLPEEPARMWIAFAGVGGEFYLSAAAMCLFYVQLPEKFRRARLSVPLLPISSREPLLRDLYFLEAGPAWFGGNSLRLHGER